jgi:hypothetical protein
MIAVALEAAVIVALVLKLRRHGPQEESTTRFHWEEPMPWMDDKNLNSARTPDNG